MFRRPQVFWNLTSLGHLITRIKKRVVDSYFRPRFQDFGTYGYQWSLYTRAVIVFSLVPVMERLLFLTAISQYGRSSHPSDCTCFATLFDDPRSFPASSPVTWQMFTGVSGTVPALPGIRCMYTSTWSMKVWLQMVFMRNRTPRIALLSCKASGSYI